MAKQKYPAGKHPNSMANLRPPGVASWAKDAERGNVRAGKHLAWAEDSKLPATEKAKARAELASALAARAPVHSEADAALIELAAAKLARIRHVEAWLDQNGLFHRGKLRNVVEKLGTLENQLAGLLSELGMTTTSRAKLGLDLVRTVDLADALSDPDPERRRAKLRDAGIVEGTAEDA